MTTKMSNERDFPDAGFIEYLRERESYRMVCDFSSPQLAWRPHFVRYMLVVCKKYGLSLNTTHLAVYLFDLFMDNHDINVDRLFLIGITCVRVVCKLEEKSTKIPEIDCIPQNAIYSSDDHRTAEAMLLTLVNWDIHLPTAASACLYILEHIAMDDRSEANGGKVFKLAIEATTLVFLERSLFGICEHTHLVRACNDISLQHSIAPSKLGAMCLAAARLESGIEPAWTDELAALTTYSWTDLYDDVVKKLLPVQKPPGRVLRHELEQYFAASNKGAEQIHIDK